MSFQGFGPRRCRSSRRWRSIRAGNGSRRTARLTRALSRRRWAISSRMSPGGSDKAKIPIKGDRKSSLFRIHRDVRFSKNKDPYKTNAGVALTRSGGKNDPGVLYFHLSPEECFFAAGFHLPEPDQLARLRAAAARAPKPFKAMTAKLRKAGLALSRRGCAQARPARLRGRRRRRDRRRDPAQEPDLPAPGRRGARSRRRRSPTTSAPSRAMRCRSSHGAGTRSPTRGERASARGR